MERYDQTDFVIRHNQIKGEPPIKSEKRSRKVSYQNIVLRQILLERNKGAYLSATAVMRNQWLSRDSVYGNVKYVFEGSCVAVPYNQ